ncbi:MAG: hypothetical protein M1827_000822 [Pycnora praestabilis]|nr:MAG: hypothetical protein M1827_000822 [Pycnora praestabilis]
MAPSQTHTVQSRGIYHGLPTFSPSVRNLKAIVAGANGISGKHMVRALSQAPERWSKIFALSRRPPLHGGAEDARNVKHLAVDFLSEPEEIARVLREEGVEAYVSHQKTQRRSDVWRRMHWANSVVDRVSSDYVFFFSYVQPAPKAGQALWTNAEEMCEINGRLLRNTLQALRLASITPRRFILQTGQKHYGSHLGPVSQPEFESDPRVTIEPNFYYVQEDLLFAHYANTPTQWNIIRPSFILGAVKDAAMNSLYPLAIYATVQMHMRQPLKFPGDLAAWDKGQVQSTAMLNSYLSEWAALTEEAGDQAFNAGDDFPFTWGRFWPVLAGWYGLGWAPPEERAEYRSVESSHAPRGYGPKGITRYTFTLVEWANQPTVQNAWAEMTKEHGLAQTPFNDIERIFSFTDFSLLMSWPYAYSMDKAKKLGWFGYVNTFEAIQEVFEEFEKLKMTPPLRKVGLLR